MAIDKGQSSSQEDSQTLQAYYGLSSKVCFCRKCVISNQRPSSTVEFKNRNGLKETIAFDEEGVCEACRYADIKRHEINWKEREEQLIKLCAQYRSRLGNYVWSCKPVWRGLPMGL